MGFLFRLLCFLLFPLMFFSLSHALDQPDLEYEAWLHEIYQEYHRHPHSAGYDDAVKNIIQSGQQEYPVRSGDNLYNVSRDLLGEADYWPTLWAKNSDITNPHIIYPRRKLALTKGQAKRRGRPYKPKVIKFRKASEADDDGKRSFKTLTVSLPQPKKPLKPVLQSFPLGLPKWSSVARLARQDQFHVLNFDFEKYKWNSEKNVYYLKYFVAGSTLSIEGELTGYVDEVLLQKGSVIHLRAGEVTPGSRFAVIKKQQSVEGEHVYQVLGEVQVNKKISNNWISKDVYEAKVTLLFSRISVGDLIINSPAKFFQHSKAAVNFSGRAGKILGGNRGNSHLFYLNDFVFLSKGSDAGLRAGDRYPIYQNLQSREKSFGWGSTPSGFLQILEVREGVSTAMITGLVNDIQVGDRVGQAFN